VHMPFGPRRPLPWGKGAYATLPCPHGLQEEALGGKETGGKDRVPLGISSIARPDTTQNPSSL